MKRILAIAALMTCVSLCAEETTQPAMTNNAMQSLAKDKVGMAPLEHAEPTHKELSAVDRELHSAAVTGDLDLAKKAVQEKNADINSVNTLMCHWTPLHTAANWLEPRMVDFVLKNKADINKQDKFGDTALHVAVDHPSRLYDVKKRFEVVSILVKSKADLSVKNNQGKTAFQIAKRMQEEGDDNKDITRLLYHAENWSKYPLWKKALIRSGLRN